MLRVKEQSQKQYSSTVDKEICLNTKQTQGSFTAPPTLLCPTLPDPYLLNQECSLSAEPELGVVRPPTHIHTQKKSKKERKNRIIIEIILTSKGIIKGSGLLTLIY